MPIRTLRRVLRDMRRSIEINLILNRCASLAYMVGEAYYQETSDHVATLSIALLNDIVGTLGHKSYTYPDMTDLVNSRQGLRQLCQAINRRRGVSLTEISQLNRIRRTLTRVSK